MDPENIDAYSHSGKAYGSISMYSQAVAFFDEVIKRSPNNLNAHSNAYEEVIKREPSPEAYGNKGLAHASIGEYQKALECYDEAILKVILG